MVTQPSPPKTSSTTLEALRELLSRVGSSVSASESFKTLLTQVLPSDPQKFLKLGEQWQRFMYDHSRRVILDLANVSAQAFKQEFPWYATMTEQELQGLSNDLQKVWSRRIPPAETRQILDGWTNWNPQQTDAKAWMPFLPLARIWPRPGNLRGVLAIGVMQNYPHLAICADPECGLYFLAKRKDQKFCGRGYCTAYAQRQYALKWWRDKGEKLRQKRKKSKGKRVRTKRRTKR